LSFCVTSETETLMKNQIQPRTPNMPILQLTLHVR
jgi:hypothetical protein